MARLKKMRLGEILVEQKTLTEEQIRLALEEQQTYQRKVGRVRRLGRILIQQGVATEVEVAEALANQLGIVYVDLKHYDLKPEITTKLPEIYARRFRVLLLEEGDKTVRVGMADPTDLNAYDELARVLQREIEVVVVIESQLVAVIDRIYRRTSEITDLAQQLGADLKDTAVSFRAPAQTPGLQDAPVVKLMQTVFEDATQVRASDIHIEPQEKKLVIRFRIDGVLHLQTEADPGIAGALVQRLKLMAGLDISEKRLPQDGRFNVKVRASTIDVRMSSMPTQYGESVVMRLLNQGGGIVTLDKLGMPPHILERVQAVLRRPSGMMLVTGPTGSGKTTTLYAALAALNTPARKLITVEDPVEYRLAGVNQVQVHEKIDLSFARVLRSALRQDPDVILVGEMRDQETVETGLRAAMTGHLVLSTLHTNDAVSTPIRLLDMKAPRYMVALSLQLVLAQRLVRLICESCSEPYSLLPNEHEWLALELGAKVEEHRYVKGKGCSSCNGTGYLGRTGVYEMLEMTKPVVAAANQDNMAKFIKAATREMGGHTLRAHVAQLVADGKTTVEEGLRISSQVED